MFLPVQLLLPLAAALLCPQTLFCGNLNTVTNNNAGCALLHPPYVTISLEGCDYTDQFSYCSFNDLMKTYLAVREGDQVAVMCSNWNVTEMHAEYRSRTKDLAENQDTYRQQRLKTGTHPKLCDTDQDCELLDGQFAACLCGGYGQAYCALSLGDPFMLPMYNRASVGDELEVDYFLSYQRAFAYQYSKTDCDVLFIEHELVMDADYALRRRKNPNSFSSARFLTVVATFVGIFT